MDAAASVKQTTATTSRDVTTTVTFNKLSPRPVVVAPRRQVGRRRTSTFFRRPAGIDEWLMSTTPAAHLLNYGPTNKAPIKLIVSARNTRAVITLMTPTCKSGGADIQMSLISIRYRPVKKFTSQSTGGRASSLPAVHQTIGHIPIEGGTSASPADGPASVNTRNVIKKRGPTDHLRRPKVKNEEQGT
jgi:hypothetical protein